MEIPKNLISLVELELNLDEMDTRSQGTSSSSIMELAALASILAYENEARIKDTVRDGTRT